MWAPQVGPSHVSIHSGFGSVGTWMIPEAKFGDLDAPEVKFKDPEMVF
jgi:hypothetical protein